MADPALTPRTKACGCGGAPRRLCDVCYSTEQVFLACSSDCLARHQAAQHPGHAGLDAVARARAFAESVNGRFPDNWQRYAPHRHRLMQLVEQAGTGGRLAVFGAGNASDLELAWLTRCFDEVHLIDLDGPALNRARARHAIAHPERLVLHSGVDLSGFLEQLDPWGEAFPEPAELGARAVEAAGKLVRELGRFEVTLSTCVLSQLGLPFRRAWVASRAAWAHLGSAITAVHLATLAGVTSRAGVLVCDVATTQRLPELDAYRERPSAELAAFVATQQAQGALGLNPDPRSLLAWLTAPGLRGMVSAPRLLEPWLWDLGDVRQLVYALTFRHPR
ncbi:MAG TPA: hypothetical protein VHP33_04300 [Polyangiaceae bacterium]|nr:hypothetical protein [Polyangiaceae bacterium]